jgi:hypothetical protein
MALVWSTNMAFPHKTALLLTGLLSVATAPALAASSASSAVSDSLTTSVGSVSNSLGRSSDSSKGGEKTAAVGDYKIVEVTAAKRPAMDGADTVRLTLHAVAATAPDDELFLYVPRATLNQAQLAAGQVVTATPRPYGTEFSLATTGQAFFLVLQDEWYRDLRTQAVTL